MIVDVVINCSIRKSRVDSAEEAARLVLATPLDAVLPFCYREVLEEGCGFSF